MAIPGNFAIYNFHKYRYISQLIQYKIYRRLQNLVGYRPQQLFMLFDQFFFSQCHRTICTLPLPRVYTGGHEWNSRVNFLVIVREQFISCNERYFYNTIAIYTGGATCTDYNISLENQILWNTKEVCAVPSLIHIASILWSNNHTLVQLICRKHLPKVCSRHQHR